MLQHFMKLNTEEQESSDKKNLKPGESTKLLNAQIGITVLHIEV